MHQFLLEKKLRRLEKSQIEFEIFTHLLVLSRFETIFLTKMSFSLAPWDANSRRLTRSPFSNLLISEFSEFENFSRPKRNFSGFLILASICLILSSIFTTSFCKSAMSFLSLSLTAFGDSLSSSAYFSQGRRSFFWIGSPTRSKL